MNLTVTVTGSQQSSTVTPAYAQLSTIPRWLPILMLLACCVIIPLFAFLAWPRGRAGPIPYRDAGADKYAGEYTHGDARHRRYADGDTGHLDGAR